AGLSAVARDGQRGPERALGRAPDGVARRHQERVAARAGASAPDASRSGGATDSRRRGCRPVGGATDSRRGGCRPVGGATDSRRGGCRPVGGATDNRRDRSRSAGCDRRRDRDTVRRSVGWWLAARASRSGPAWDAGGAGPRASWFASFAARTVARGWTARAWRAAG